MLNSVCDLKYCDATVGDCVNPDCRCIVCFGKESNNCKIVEMQHRSGVNLRKIICSQCEHYNGK